MKDKTLYCGECPHFLYGDEYNGFGRCMKDNDMRHCSEMCDYATYF